MSNNTTNFKFGFTGTKQGMSLGQKIGVFSLLKKFYILRDPPDEFHHGDCEGSDFQAAEFAHDIGYYVICHPPTNPKHRGWFEYNDMIHPESEYIPRDQHIVDDSVILIATPHTPYEITRSGTWTTIRYARRMNREIFIIRPDGSLRHELHKMIQEYKLVSNYTTQSS